MVGEMQDGSVNVLHLSEHLAQSPSHLSQMIEVAKVTPPSRTSKKETNFVDQHTINNCWQMQHYQYQLFVQNSANNVLTLSCDLASTCRYPTDG